MIKIRHLTTGLLLFSLTISCNENPEVAPKKPIEKIARVSLANEVELEGVLNSIGFADSQTDDVQNGRTNSFGIQIDTESILKVIQADSLHHTYTFDIQDEFPENSFSNLIIEELENGYLAFILHYASLQEYMGMQNFTGTLTRSNIDESPLSEWTFSNGQLEKTSSPNGRTTTENCYRASVGYECTSWGYIYNYGGSQTTGFGCLNYETVLILNEEPCASNSGGDTGGQCYTCPTGGTYVPPSNPTGSGGGTTTGGAPKPKPIGVSANSMCGTGNVFHDGVAKCVSKADAWELDQINDTQLKPCMKTILTDVKNLTQGSVGQVIQKFSGEIPGYNWEVKDGVLAEATGETSPLYNKTTGTVTTIFDSQSWKSATELSWARTILHESVHAYLIVFYNNDQLAFIKNYPKMVQDWGTLQNWNAVHHEEFARSLVNIIAVALEEYGKTKGYNLSRQFYEDMSWAGLQNTSSFQNLPTSDKTRILDTIAVELTGKDASGSSKTQKGKNAGC